MEMEASNAYNKKIEKLVRDERSYNISFFF